jgi:hypothetical protein
MMPSNNGTSFEHINSFEKIINVNFFEFYFIERCFTILVVLILTLYNFQIQKNLKTENVKSDPEKRET